MAEAVKVNGTGANFNGAGTKTEYGRMECWNDGFSSENATIPSFHYSIIPFFQCSRLSIV
jgi:hypothetical protein